MAKVACPDCGEINKNLATKCYKCGTSLRREHIKKYVENKHGERLNYKKHKGKRVDRAKSSGGSIFGKIIMAFVFMVLLAVIGFAAALYFEVITLHQYI